MVCFILGPAGDPGNDGYPGRDQEMVCEAIEAPGGVVNCNTLPAGSTYSMMGCYCSYSCQNKVIENGNCNCNCPSPHTHTKGMCCRMVVKK